MRYRLQTQNEDSALMEQVFDRVSQSLKDGELVCISPEGKITSTDELSSFKPYIKKVLDRDSVSVVPLALRGLWAAFSVKNLTMSCRGLCRVFFYNRIALIASDPIPARDDSLTILYDTISKQL